MTSATAVYLNKLDRAAAAYRAALKNILDECSHDKPRLDRIRQDAERGIANADRALASQALFDPVASKTVHRP